MRTKSLLPMLAAASLSLAACATPFRADVARFQAMPAPQGQSYAIVPRDEADRGGLEFAHYAGLVSAEMTRLGYRAAQPAEAADLTVTMGYGVDQGRERVVRTGDGFYDPFWGPGWGYARGFGRPFIVRTRYGFRYVHGFYDPFLSGFGGFGDFGGERRYTVYSSNLTLAITRTAGGEELFDGSAEAVSRSNDLTQLVPNLVEAMFTGFPGNSGERVRITIAPPENARR